MSRFAEERARGVVGELPVRFALQLRDSGLQPIRDNRVCFLFRCDAIERIQSVAGFIQRNMPAGIPFPFESVGNEIHERTFAAGKRLAKVSEVQTRRRILKNKLRPPGGRCGER